MDVGAPERKRAREWLRKLDLVMLAVAINVNNGPFTAFRQDSALALDGTLENHDAELQDVTVFCEQIALCENQQIRKFSRLKLSVCCLQDLQIEPRFTRELRRVFTPKLRRAVFVGNVRIL